jgi:hypothetical protein
VVVRLLFGATFVAAALSIVACSAETPPPAVSCEITQTPGFDANLEAVRGDRDNYERVIFVLGDSIGRGFGLNMWAEDTPRDHPLWELRSPASMINMMLRDSGERQDLDDCGTVTRAATIAVYAGPTGQPAGAAGVATHLRNLVQQRIIRAGDVVVFEDAGDHGESVQQYADNWIMVREALRDSGVTVVMMTMHDTLENEPERTLFRYDVPDASGRTFNDATRQAAAHEVSGAPATLVDLKAALASMDQRGAQTGVRSLLADNIHPNVWGQCVIAASVVRASGVRAQRWQSMPEILRQHSDALTNTSALNPPGPEAANAAVRLCAEAANVAPRLRQ